MAPSSPRTAVAWPSLGGRRSMGFHLPTNLMQTIAVIFAAIGVSALCIPAHGQQPSGGSIVGLVRDTAGRPLPGANVSLYPGDQRTQTDSSGRFAITGLGDNNYTVRARKIGYRRIVGTSNWPKAGGWR